MHQINLYLEFLELELVLTVYYWRRFRPDDLQAPMLLCSCQWKVILCLQFMGSTLALGVIHVRA